MSQTLLESMTLDDLRGSLSKGLSVLEFLARLTPTPKDDKVVLILRRIVDDPVILPTLWELLGKSEAPPTM